jgi:threonine/homoserine/homoserine lactone efflux protein
MLSVLVLAVTLAFAAAIQPGPLQAYLLSSVAQRGWKRTLPAALSPLLSDAPIILTALFLLTRLPEAAARILQAAGGLLLLYFAWRGYQDWRRGPAAEAEDTGRGSRTLLEAIGVNLLNPNPWLGWSLVMGPALLAAWRSSPSNGVAFLVAFYSVLVGTTALIVLLFGTTRLLSPPLRRTLILLSALLLAALGIYRLALSILGS